MPPADSRTRSGKQTRVVPAPANGASLLPSAQLDDFSGDPNFMTSLARGLAVIQAFSTRTHQLTISHVSDKTGFSRAAVRRCLYTLAQLGFADPTTVVTSSSVPEFWRSVTPTFPRCP